MTAIIKKMFENNSVIALIIQALMMLGTIIGYSESKFANKEQTQMQFVNVQEGTARVEKKVDEIYQYLLTHKSR